MSDRASPTPRVSVLLPVYNGRRYLRAAVTSMLEQSYRDMELLLLDDGSTDNSLLILRGLAAADSRVRVTTRENRGLIATLNEGIAAARGEFIARMDADDVSLPERIAKQVEFLDRNPDHVAVGCFCLMIDPRGHPITTMRPPTDHEGIDRMLLSGRGGALPHPGVLMRTRVARESGGYRSEFHAAEDVDFLLRLGEIGLLANLGEVLLLYRMHLSSESRTKAEQQVRNTMAAADAAHVRRGLPRPEPGPEQVAEEVSVAEHHRRWALWALKAGNRGTAMRHAARALLRDPLCPRSWRLVKWVLRGHN